MSWKKSWKKTTWLESPFSAPHRKRQAAKRFIALAQLSSLYVQMALTINQQRSVVTQTESDRVNKVLAISRTRLEWAKRAQEIMQGYNACMRGEQ